MTKKQKSALVIYLLLILFSSCAEVQHNVKYDHTDLYGFWGGLWHGIIIPFSWFCSLFNDDVAIYAINNNGGWYNFGFVLGIGGLSFSSKK